MADEVRAWTESFRVRTYESDANGLVYPAALCGYLQEAAGNHARSLGVSIEQMNAQGLTWMLSRLRLEIQRVPTRRDNLEVETWPSGSEGLVANRDFLVRDGSGREVARATTAWLVIDMERRRPTRVPSTISSLPLSRRERALTGSEDRLPPIEQAGWEADVQVRWSDLDVNRHTNNVRYVAWVMDCTPSSVQDMQRLVALDIDFVAESVLEERLRIRVDGVASGDHGVLLHQIERTASGDVIARARTRWVPVG